MSSSAAGFARRAELRGSPLPGQTAAMRSVFVLALVLLGVDPFAHAGQGPEPAIRALLGRQVEAWNRRDLEGYMGGYWRSPDLTFYGGDTVTRGWHETLQRYRTRYQGEGKEMGRLEMTEVEVELVAPRVAVVRGRWHLAMADGKARQGLFTLLLRRLPEGWRVVHDHSS